MNNRSESHVLITDKIAWAKKDLDALEAALDTEERRICFEKYGVAPGSLVSDDKGDIYKVTAIAFKASEAPWLKGQRKRKPTELNPEEWTNRVYPIYGVWKLIEEVSDD